jgi:radical SAM protein with 4Fe4S-binding SPASM domain
VELERYQDFSARFHRKVVGARVPAEGTIEVTRRCPLTCVHCYNNLPVTDRAARDTELTTAEHHRIVDEIAEAGCIWLLYTGGEILARGDFLDIYTHAKKRGMLVTLFTNGTMITPKVADHLAEWRPFAIEITLYGRTRETYERLTGIPGSYDRCMRGISLLLERRLPLKLKTVAVTVNRHEIWEMKRFAEEDLGVEFKFDAMINPRIDCSQSPLSVRLTPAEVVALDVQDPRRTDAWKSFCERFHGPAHTPDKNGELYVCGGGMTSFAIDPLGKMSICTLSHFDTYDLRTGSFREGWEKFLRKVRSKKMTQLTKCVACSLKAMCGMCPANGELENGDPEAPVNFLCHVAHLRAHALGMPVPAHGECEYCEGGANYADLLESLAALEQAKSAVGESGLFRRAEGMSLPVLGSASRFPSMGCGSGGCHSCASGGEELHGRGDDEELAYTGSAVPRSEER